MREDTNKYSEHCALCGQRFVGKTPDVPRDALTRHAASHCKRVDPQPLVMRAAQPRNAKADT